MKLETQDLHEYWCKKRSKQKEISGFKSWLRETKFLPDVLKGMWGGLALSVAMEAKGINLFTVDGLIAWSVLLLFVLFVLISGTIFSFISWKISRY